MTSNIERIRLAEQQLQSLASEQNRLHNEAIADGEIDADEQRMLDRVKGKIDQLEKIVTQLRAAFEENKRIWESRAAEVADFQGNLANLQSWTFIAFDLFEDSLTAIITASEAEDYAAANVELTQATVNMTPAYEQYITQSTARAAFDPQWSGLPERIASASVSQYERLVTVQQDMITAQGRIEAAIPTGDYVTALAALPNLVTALEAYEQQHLEIETARAEFEAAHNALAAQIGEFSQSRPEWHFMADKHTAFADFLSQMEAQQDEEEFTAATATLASIADILTEMTQLIEAKARFDEAETKADTILAAITDHGTFKDIQTQYANIMSSHADALHAASSGAWDDAAVLMSDTALMCETYKELLAEQQAFLDQITANLPALTTKADGLAAATSAKKTKADKLIASVKKAMADKAGLAKAVEDLQEVDALLDEVAMISDISTRLTGAAAEDMDDVAKAIVAEYKTALNLADLPGEARNMLIEALTGGDAVDASEHAAIADIWSEEDFVDREFDAVEAEVRERIVNAIANDPEVIAMSRDWATYTDEEKRKAYEKLAAIPATEWGIDAPPVSVFSESWTDGSILLGEYAPGADTMKMNISTDAETDFSFAERMGTLVHEIGHKYQEEIEQQYRDGTLQPGDPAYEQARSHFLDDEYQSNYPAEFQNLYETSPDEAHSRNMGHEMQEAMERAIAEAEARAAAEAAGT